MEEYWQNILKDFSGELYYNQSANHQAVLLAYSNDASVYQEKPLAVALPKNVVDLKLLVDFAQINSLTLIPRAAGTSLAGQVVGNGIVVDISKYFDRIIEVNVSEKWVKVQPGVIRDDLNNHLLKFGLMFGPETSTANRAMIGGMVGNNSSGLHSIVWGDVRGNIIEASVILSDGSEAVFSQDDLVINTSPESLKGKIIHSLFALLSDKNNAKLIKLNSPKAAVLRRNTGYALDRLLQMQPFEKQGQPFNICKLLAGSEGTLAFLTEVKLGLIDLPPKEIAVVCVHTRSINEALKANIIALKHLPMASELVDKLILDFTVNHPEYHKKRFFIEGDPEAILMIEFIEEDIQIATNKAQGLISDLRQNDIGYAFPILYNQQTKHAWDIRKAGLGLLRNMRGDAQPVNLIEDCAVDPLELPQYISDVQEALARNEVKASYYAHAGAGEIHVEPMINLKSEAGLAAFRNILTEVVDLVKKYNGSLSGEHGDGRLRGEFIPAVVGKETYELFKKVKTIFDPNNIFNAGKIVSAPAMDTFLRTNAKSVVRKIATNFDFTAQGDILSLAEKCSGSGDCRKSAITGGVMCPSYMATREEKDTTRARANVLRQFLSNEHDEDPLNHKEIMEVMDLCVSCKGCKTECPSGVDVTKMKAEFFQYYYDKNGTPLRVSLIGNFSKQMKLVSYFPWAYNFMFQNKLIRKVANRIVGFHPERSIPRVSNITFRSWFKNRSNISSKERKVYLFCDEFTNYNDVEVGKKAVLLLEALGFEISIPTHVESGRTYLSKGLLKKAAKIANENINLLADLITSEHPLIGIEPSAILTFRDEYIDLAVSENIQKAINLSQNTFSIEEFIAREARLGNIERNKFTTQKRIINIHGHCYQKALSSQQDIISMLTIPINYETSVIPSGCCGMAGSFGYEKEHYAVSQQIGELVLFPAIRALSPDILIAASGTSCRHHIKDGTHSKALHPVEILYNALV